MKIESTNTASLTQNTETANANRSMQAGNAVFPEACVKNTD